MQISKHSYLPVYLIHKKYVSNLQWGIIKAQIRFFFITSEHRIEVWSWMSDSDLYTPTFNLLFVDKETLHFIR